MEELVRRELIHTNFLLKDEAFFELIDASGGWPVGYRYVSLYHDGPCGENRYCKFTNVRLNTEWWSTICSSDDYYYWKLSSEKIRAIAVAVRSTIAHELLLNVPKV